MVGAPEQKKAYMHRYNRKPEVRALKADYMRRKRVESNEEAARKLVTELLSMGYENLAFEYAQERAPEMLAVVKATPKHTQK
jgi:transposase